MPMNSDLQNLIELEKIDREIGRLTDEVSALPKRIAEIEHKLSDAKAQVEQAKNAIRMQDSKRRQHESEIQSLQSKISKFRDQSLEVKTNEQYKALMHEIQFAEQDIRANEDKILELMVSAEAREKDVKAAELELKEETAEIEKEKVAARERTVEDEKQLAEWNAKREKARSAVSADLLQHYDRVTKYRGSGIAEARDQKCMGCQVMLRPQTFNEVRTGERTVSCDSCQRILYYVPGQDTVTTAVAASTHRRRAHPKLDASRAWYYRSDYDAAGEVFLSYINADGNSSRRVYDVHTGRKLEDTLVR